jgi:hypothetical protein
MLQKELIMMLVGCMRSNFDDCQAMWRKKNASIKGPLNKSITIHHPSFSAQHQLSKLPQSIGCTSSECGRLG